MYARPGNSLVAVNDVLGPAYSSLTTPAGLATNRVYLVILSLYVAAGDFHAKVYMSGAGFMPSAASKTAHESMQKCWGTQLRQSCIACRMLGAHA